MIKDATKQIIKRTLQSSFDKEQFLNFTKNLLNHIDESKAQHFRGYVKHQFKQATGIVKTYERLGTYTDPNEKKIDILVVYLAKDNSIDRARTSLRNFVADYLKGRDQKDAALVAFVSPSQDDWRFSLIKMEYKFEEGQNGKMKVKEEFTPARRWSFLVGSKESSHTAQSRLAPILEDDENKPTLEQLEDTFNIEKVTKEFFEKYRELFLGLKDNLDEMVKNDAKIKADFAEKDVDTVDFAKKLLGQIVFLYFLQKKGWFGVERDANWGTGPKDFLRQLHNKKHSEYKNFFNEILEPMFYEALARERDDDYYGSFNCRIPFLNGGLFDPIGNYDWVHTDINLDNELFSNSRPTKQGDIGDGILDVFDRYNFTVREDEPLEKEVAVDPEMLGKVFENLLEVKDRKSKGTYYTPREIVHYMCEQSLINYLATELNSPFLPEEGLGVVGEVTKSDIETFIKTGSQILEAEILAVEKDNKSNLPKSIIDNAKLIDQKLADIKVCDPAIGSGAFPVGMMSEIVNARLSLNPFLCHSGLDPESSSLECAGRTAYDFKMQAITNSIYGVDIDPGAVEIAKLRLWLSLVVDENDIKQIKPLPNLDYKIMQGNSLLEEFEGIKLFDESIIPQDHADREAQITKANEKINELQREFFRLHSKNELSKSQEQLIKQQIKGQQKLIQSLQEQPKQGGTVDLFNQIDEIKAKWDELTELHKKIVNESNRQEKKQMLDRASELEWQFIEATLKREDKSESLKKIERFKKKNTKPFFLWHLHFSDVFQTEGGFDIVIANPPYVRQEEITQFKESLGNTYKVFSSRADLYTYFYEKGLGLLNDSGTLTFITSNKFMRAKYGDKLRDYIQQNFRLLEIVDFGDVHKFEAITNTLILILAKNFKKDNLFAYSDTLDSDRMICKQSELRIDAWTLAGKDVLDLKRKIETDGLPLSEWPIKVSYGIKAGFNEAFVIEQNLRDELLKENPGNNNIVLPLLRGRDIGRYITKFAGKYIIFSKYEGHELLKKSYPEIVTHLGKFEEKLKERGQVRNGQHHWLELDNNPNDNYLNLFTQPKIIWLELSDKNKFTYTENGECILAGAFMITGESLKYLLAFLNSKLCLFYFNLICNSSGMDTVQWKKFVVDRLPVPQIAVEGQAKFVGVVDKILTITKSSDYLENPTKKEEVKEYEHQIDQMVYKLYGLTSDEIKIVEGV